MSISLLVSAGLQGSEQPAQASAPAANTQGGASAVQLNGYNVSGILYNDGSTPKADLSPIDMSRVLGAATETVDLTAAPKAVNIQTTINLTGGKLLAILAVALEANLNPITIGPGSADPYPLFGSGNSIELLPGQLVLLSATKLITNVKAVSATEKNIDITGTIGEGCNVIAYFSTDT